MSPPARHAAGQTAAIRRRLDALPIEPWQPTDADAAEYVAPLLRAEAETVRVLATELRRDSIDSAVDRLGQVEQSLGSQLSDAKLGALILLVGSRARDRADRAWSAAVSRARGSAVTLSREPSAAALEAWTNENLRRLRGLRTGALHGVQRALLDAQRRGLSAESLAARWEREGLPLDFGTMRGRTIVVARDQLGKLAAGIAEAQQRALGVTHYRWRGRLDTREREAHLDREGSTFSWARPPSDGHPGHPVLCRCWAEPVIDPTRLARSL